MTEVPPRRSGRRPGDSGTRTAILDAARESFGASGYAGTTIRGIARTAGVDPALVHRFFGSKESLFGASLALPFDPADLIPRILAGGPGGLGDGGSAHRVPSCAAATSPPRVNR